MTVSCQSSVFAASAQVPIRSPFSLGRPRCPVGGGFGPDRTALDGSRVVHVVPLMTRDSPWKAQSPVPCTSRPGKAPASILRSEEHTSELQSLAYLVCRLLL